MPRIEDPAPTRRQRRVFEPPPLRPRLKLAGLAVGLGVLAGVALAHAGVVINEIHYAPDVKTEAVEFIELYNDNTTGVDLGGWAFTAGVDFVFPAGTSLAPGGFAVVAQDPVALKTKFGVTALGPWSGRLSNHDDHLVLRDAAGELVDEVDYQLGFPWPTVGDAPGYSIELMHPTADRSLGGHWRASFTGGGAQQTTLVLDAGATWRYAKGKTAPPADWMNEGFDDSAWSAGPTPVGYDPGVAIGTRLDDMRSGYSDFFLRRTFTVANAAAVTSLTLEALYDDGFKVWINDADLLDVSMPAGTVPFDQLASPVRENDAFEIRSITVPPGLLRDGDNVIAVQVANSSLGQSSDCFFDARLRTVTGPTGRGPTPGRINATFTSKIPPAIRQLEQSPQQPGSGQPVVISAKVTSAAGIGSVVLQYQVVEPGGYIEWSDAAYATNWTAAPMNDVGISGDTKAADDVFTVTLPGTLQKHRRLIRYRIVATDATGLAVTAPYADDPQPNFAYFCHDGVPAWNGAVQPGGAGALGQAFTVSGTEMNRLPVYYLIAKKTAVENCTWLDRSHGDEYFWVGTLVYDGVVYDHIHFRPRGGVWRYAMGKNMWKFDFNRGHDFQPRDNWGRRLGTAWTKLNLGASIQQGDYQHRGEQGLFESVGFRLFQLTGQPAMHTTYVQFRIVDEAAEVTTGNQYAGDFWGLYLAVEQPDGRFLEEHGLADGNFYKMEGGGGDPNNLSPTGPSNGSDLTAFMSAYNSRPAESWWRTNFNLTAYFNYQSIVQAIHHYDIADGKNYFYHHDPDTGRWMVTPWDLDLTWADSMYRSGQTGGDEPFKSLLLSNFSSNPANPNIAREFRNRVREIRDLLWNQDEAFRLIDEHARLLRGSESTTILDADRGQWDYNPVMNNSSIVNLSKAGWGRFYQMGTPTKTFAGMVQLMKNYVTYRASNASFSLDTMATEPQRPAQPTIAYDGPAGFPDNRLHFTVSEFSGSAFGSIKWRLAEISRAGHPAYDPTEPEHYEITPVWESAEIATASREITIPPGAAKVGHLYRVRARYTDTTGRASNWSTAAEFTAGAPDNTATLAASLRVSELMYNPPAGTEFEFIELRNLSPNAALDLAGVTFTAGIQFTFPPGSTLPANGYALVVQAAADNNFAAFRTHYGLAAGVAIFGPYSGSFANNGETVTIKTAPNGTELISFTYGDGRGWPPAADGTGHSLVPHTGTESQSTRALDDPGNWRGSAVIGGSPGRADPIPAPTVMLSELAAHTHYADPAHPEYDSNDWIELGNPGPDPVNLAGWFLSDSASDLRKWALPAEDLAPGAFVVFDELTGFHQPITAGFGLSQAGETVFLSHLDGTDQPRVVDAVAFPGQELTFTWGRLPATPEVWAQLLPSPGAPAGSRAPVPLVINELMFQPYAARVGTNVTDNVADEFVELYNPNPAAVTLSDTNGAWRLNGGISFTFPAGTVVPANGYLIAVPFDPTNTVAVAQFRQRYGVGTEPALVGPYTGKLGNNGDRVALERPLLPDRPVEPAAWVLLDEVIYGVAWPWPEGTTDGHGQSLQRVDSLAPGGPPGNWRAAWPTADATNFSASRADFDGDGLPDAWETAVGLDPQDPAGAAGASGDPDGDGLSNLAEFNGGTDPRAPTVRVLAFQANENGVNLRFNQPAHLVMRVQACDALEAATWVTLSTFPSLNAPQETSFTDPRPVTAPIRLYRVTAP